MFDRHARKALIVTVVTLLASGLGFRVVVANLNAFLEKKPVKLRAQLTAIPAQLGEWESVAGDQVLTAEVVEELGTNDYLNRTYLRDRHTPALSIDMAYYTGLIDSVPHVPDRCLVVGGFQILDGPHNIPLEFDTSAYRRDDKSHKRAKERYRTTTFLHHLTAEPITVRMPVGDLELRLTEFQSPDNPDARIYAGYFFMANGVTTPNPLGVRQFAFDLTVKYAYYAKIQFTAIGPSDFDPEDFVALVTDILPDLLPEIMRCLPDWSEVESKSDDESAAEA